MHKLRLAQPVLLGPELSLGLVAMILRGEEPLHSEIAQLALRLCKGDYFPSNCLMFLTTLTHCFNSSPPKIF